MLSAVNGWKRMVFPEPLDENTPLVEKRWS